MPKIVNGIDIERKYHFDEIMEMYHKGMLSKASVEGYIVRADADGMIGFVPWTESTLYRLERNKGIEAKWDFSDMQADVEREHPMKRTTPQEKNARLMVRIMGDVQRRGTVAGLTDREVREIVGSYWREGITEVTSDMVRAVAAHFLRKAEIANREANSKGVTRKHALA